MTIKYVSNILHGAFHSLYESHTFETWLGDKLNKTLQSVAAFSEVRICRDPARVSDTDG